MRASHLGLAAASPRSGVDLLLGVVKPSRVSRVVPSRGRRRVEVAVGYVESSRVEVAVGLRSPSAKSSRVEAEAKPTVKPCAQASVNILVELKSRWREAILAVQEAAAAVLTLRAAAPNC